MISNSIPIQVDIKVGVFIHDWVVNSTGSSVIRLDKTTNLWAIVKQHLVLRSDGYVPEESEAIGIVLLDHSRALTYNVHSERLLHQNKFFRDYVTESGQGAIRRYLENQFRQAFRMFMLGKYSYYLGKEEKIRHAICDFLLTYDLPVDDVIIERLTKDWYRFRQKNTEKYQIPIFF